jgi:hypothetical protein
MVTFSTCLGKWSSTLKRTKLNRNDGHMNLKLGNVQHQQTIQHEEEQNTVLT